MKEVGGGYEDVMGVEGEGEKIVTYPSIVNLVDSDLAL